MEKELKFLENGSYHITIQPIKEVLGASVLLHTPSGKYYSTTTALLTRSTTKLVRIFHTMLCDEIPGIGKFSDINYEYRPHEESDNVRGKGGFHVIKRSRIRSNARNLCLALITASMAHDISCSGEETPTQEWPLQISSDLKEFKLWKDEKHTHTFNIAEILDNSQLMIEDLIEIRRRILELAETMKPSEKILIHRSKNVISLGSDKGIFVRPSKLSSLIDDFFGGLEGATEHREPLKDKATGEGVIIDTTIVRAGSPTQLKKPLDATFCFNLISFGIGNAIYCQYPIKNLPEELRDILIELRRSFGTKRIYFNPEKKACWKFSDGVTEYISLEAYPADIMRNIKIAEKWLTLLVRSGEITPTPRDDAYVFTVFNDRVHWWKFGESGRVYHFDQYPKLKNQVTDITALPSAENKEVYFLNSLGGYIFFAERNENVYYNTSILGQELYDRLWEFVSDDDIFFSAEEANEESKLPTWSEIMGRFPKTFLLVDFQTREIHFKNSRSLEYNFTEATLPPHLKGIISEIENRFLPKYRKDDEGWIVTFELTCGGRDITVHIFNEENMNSRLLTKEERQTILDLSIILDDSRAPAQYKNSFRIYPDKIQLFQEHSIWVIDPENPHWETVKREADKVAKILTTYHILSTNYTVLSVSLEGFCSYEVEVTKPSQTVRETQLYDFSVQDLSCGTLLINLFKEFFDDIMQLVTE